MIKNFLSKSFLALTFSQCLLFSNLFSESFCSDWNCCKEDWWHADVKIYTGYVFGESKEIVDNPFSSCEFSSIPNGKISELTWKIKDLWVIGGSIHKDFCHTLHLTLDGWLKVHASDSTMVDNDWLNSNYRSLLTDQSRHPDTRLEDAESFRAELGYDIYTYEWDCSSLNFQILGGYKYLHWHWKAFGGSFVYNEGEDVGIFPNVLVISYKQNFHIPYLGLKIDWDWDYFGCSLIGKYTSIAHVSDKDFHALRNLTFISKFNHSTYWVIGGEFYWNFYSCFDFNLSYFYEKMESARGDLVSKGHSYSEERAHNFAKISHYHQIITLGFTGHF